MRSITVYHSLLLMSRHGRRDNIILYIVIILTVIINWTWPIWTLQIVWAPHNKLQTISKRLPTNLPTHLPTHLPAFELDRQSPI